MVGQPFDRADPAEPAGLGDHLDDLILRAEAWAASRRTLVVAAAVVVVAAGAAWWTMARASPSAPIEASIPMAEPSRAPASADGASPDGGVDSSVAATVPAGPAGDGGEGHDVGNADPAGAEVVVVHVVGAVRRPGLVALAVGDRISDAVEGAGGASVDADVERLNLASPVIDGMQIRVPVRGERGASADAPPLVQLPAAGRDPDAAATPARTGPVDLNRADAAELQRLPGIGPALADRIVAYREANGGFTSVDELEAVPGIGPAKLAGLREQATV